MSTLRVGDALPPLSLRLTSQRLAMIAAANRDFAPVHFDAEIARETGADDAYGNLMFVMSMFERSIVTWAGPGARVGELSGMKMGAFNRRGDTVTCNGIVTGVDGARVSLDVWLETSPERRTATAAAVVLVAV